MFEFFFALIMMMYYFGVIANSSIESINSRTKASRRNQRIEEWLSVVTDSKLEMEVSRIVRNRLNVDYVNELLNTIVKDIDGLQHVTLHFTMDTEKVGRSLGFSKKYIEEIVRRKQSFAILTIMAYNGKLPWYEARCGIDIPPLAMSIPTEEGVVKNPYICYFDWINKKISESNNVKEKMVVKNIINNNYYYYDAVRDSKSWTYEVLWEPTVIDPKMIKNHL